MDPVKQDQQNLIKNIMQIAPKHCENCGNKYNDNDFHVMKSTSANTLLHLKCPQCGNTYMLNVVSPMQGMVGASRIPLNLDLEDLDEITKFAGKGRIDEDLALDIYDQTSLLNFEKFITDIKLKTSSQPNQ